MRTATRIAWMLALSTSLAWALPKEGDALVSATVTDADGNATSNRVGKPTLIVYEDKNSSKDNQDFKEELAKFARQGDYRAKVELLAVADVSGYNFWPVKGFVKDAIRKESTKAGAPIYCDWDGTFRGALNLDKGKSNVVLVGKGGKVLFVSAGPLGPPARLRIFDLLKKEIE